MRCRLLQCALLPTLLVSTALADTDGWTGIGPEGGSVTAAAFDPDRPGRQYAVAQNQLFRRSDGGAWTRILPDEFIFALAAAPGGRIYVGGYGRILRSSDHGASFSASAVPTDASIGLLTVDPGDPDIVFAVATHPPYPVYGTEPQSLWRSTDGGASWQSLRELPSERIAGVAVDPDVPSTLYVGLERSGLLVSSDSGLTWSAPDSPPCGTGNGSGELPRCVAAILARPGAVLLGTYDAGVLRSTDGGASWQAVSDAAYVDHLAPAADAGDVLYAGGATVWPGLGRDADVHGLLLRSDDGGEHWRPTAAAPPAPVAAVAADPRDADHLLAATAWIDGFPSHGLYASRDGGETWQLDQRGLDAVCGYAIAAAATSTTTVLVSAPVDTASLYRSTDRGHTWTSPPLDPAPLEIRDFAVDPNDPQRIYAAVLHDGLLASSDGGATWQPRDLGGLEPLDVAVDPFAPERLYIPLNDGRLAISDDGGVTVTFAALPDSNGLLGAAEVAVDDAGGAIYALGFGVLFVSRDHGDSWQQALYAAGNDSFSALAVAPTAPPTVYVAGSDGLHVSEDGGRTWAVAPLPLVPLQEVQVLAVDPSDGRVAYGIAYGPNGPEMLRTADSGRSWRSLGRSPVAHALAVDPNDGHILYAGVCGSGVERLVQPGAGSGAGGDGCAVAPPTNRSGPLLAHALVIVGLLWMRAAVQRRCRRTRSEPAP